MLKYIVLFKFRDPEECLPTVIEKLHGMVGKIPEILSMETGAVQTPDVLKQSVF